MALLGYASWPPPPGALGTLWPATVPLGTGFTLVDPGAGLTATISADVTGLLSIVDEAGTILASGTSSSVSIAALEGNAVRVAARFTPAAGSRLMQLSLTGTEPLDEQLLTVAQANARFLSQADAATTYATALGTLTARDALVSDRLVERGSADAQLALAKSQLDYADATAFYEDWADLSDWTAGIGTAPAIAVSGGRVYGTGGTKPNIAKAFTFQATGRGRVKSLLRFVAGGAARNSVFGFSNLAPGAARNNDLNDFVGVGIFFNGTDALLISYDRGAPSFGTNMGNVNSTYIVSLYRDEFTSSATITTGDGKIEWGVTVPSASYTPQQLEWWGSDARGTGGDSLDPITGRGATVTHVNRINENSLLTPTRSTLLGNGIHVATPASMDSRKPYPLVIYYHGYGGTELGVLQNVASSNIYLTYAELLANGYMVASSLAGGSGECGTGYASYVDLYKYVRDHYAIGPVILLAESFGGVAALLSLAQRAIPDVAAFVGIYPVTNLASVYANNAVLKAAIDTAYGIPGSGTYATRTNGFDPNLIDGRLYRGVPMLLRHSPADTTLSKTDNADLFATKLATYSTVTVETTTGNHGDPSNFGTILPFLAGALGS